jgi:hypothetical protein
MGTGYNVLVAYLDPLVTGIIGNYNVTNNATYLSSMTNSPSSSHDIATEIFDNQCVAGVYVMPRHTGEFGNAPAMSVIKMFSESQGTYHTVGIWAPLGFCDKTDP